MRTERGDVRELPKVTTLPQAVETVIESNRADGYPPTRFIQMTGNGQVPNLFEVIRSLIHSDKSRDALVDALDKYPTLLAIEDLVVVHGAEWGFEEETITRSQANAQLYDQIAGGQRYRNEQRSEQ